MSIYEVCEHAGISTPVPRMVKRFSTEEKAKEYCDKMSGAWQQYTYDQVDVEG